MAKATSRFRTDDLIHELEAPPDPAPNSIVPAEHKPMVLRKITERTVDEQNRGSWSVSFQRDRPKMANFLHEQASCRRR